MARATEHIETSGIDNCPPGREVPRRRHGARKRRTAADNVILGSVGVAGISLVVAFVAVVEIVRDNESPGSDPDVELPVPAPRASTPETGPLDYNGLPVAPREAGRGVLVPELVPKDIPPQDKAVFGSLPERVRADLSDRQIQLPEGSYTSATVVTKRGYTTIVANDEIQIDTDSAAMVVGFAENYADYLSGNGSGGDGVYKVKGEDARITRSQHVEKFIIIMGQDQPVQNEGTIRRPGVEVFVNDAGDVAEITIPVLLTNKFGPVAADDVFLNAALSISMTAARTDGQEAQDLRDLAAATIAGMGNSMAELPGHLDDLLSVVGAEMNLNRGEIVAARDGAIPVISGPKPS